MSEHDAERELLGAWALDAVDDVERAAVERAIRADPALAEEARALRETAALLAVDSAVAPPARVRADVLDAIARTPQRDGATGAPAEDARPARGSSRSGPRASTPRRGGRWLAAAAVLLAAAIPGTVAIQQAQRAERAEEQVAAIADVLSRPDAGVLAADVEGGGRAAAVVTADSAVFAAQDLPALDDGRVYQLWVIAEGAPTSAGVLNADGGSVSTSVAGFPVGGALAVTVEPAGGSQQPTTTPLVVLASDA